MLFSIVEMESNAALADKASAVRPLSLLVVLFHSELVHEYFRRSEISHLSVKEYSEHYRRLSFFVLIV